VYDGLLHMCVLQCDAVWRIVMQCVAVCCSVLQCVEMCVAVCCSVLKRVAMCCNVFQFAAAYSHITRMNESWHTYVLFMSHILRRNGTPMSKSFFA